MRDEPWMLWPVAVVAAVWLVWEHRQQVLEWLGL